jgi:hypothetical protein
MAANIVHPISPAYGSWIARQPAAIDTLQTVLYASDWARLGQRNNHSNEAANADADAPITIQVCRGPPGPAGLPTITTGTATRRTVKTNVAIRHRTWSPRSRR